MKGCAKYLIEIGPLCKDDKRSSKKHFTGKSYQNFGAKWDALGATTWESLNTISLIWLNGDRIVSGDDDSDQNSSILMIKW